MIWHLQEKRGFMHYYQHNIADYRKDTSHLSLLEHGVYHQLLDQYYLSEAPIPLDLTKLFRLMSAKEQNEISAIENVLNDFFIKTESGYVHRRCEIEIEAYHLKSTTASNAAKKRWTDADAMQTHSDGITNHKPANHKPKTIKPKTTLTESEQNDFDIFWNAYPKKVGKDKAMAAWKTKQANIKEVLEALVWQMKSDQWFKNEGQYIPNPTTYLNQGRWKDEPPIPITF